MRSRNPLAALLALLATACGSSEPGASPSLELGGTSHAFGTVAVGSESQPRRFTLTNAGDGPTGTLAVALSGSNHAEFAIVSEDCTGRALQPTDTCRIDVRMRPMDVGTKAAKLEVSDGGGNSASVALAGMAGAGGIVMVTSAHDFGPTGTNAPSSPYVFVVQNAGPVAVGPLQSALSGPQAVQFESTSDTCTGVTLPIGISCGVTVRFRPTTAGASLAALTVSDAAGASTSATLRGQGGAPVTLALAPASHDFGFAAPGSSQALVTVSVTNESDVTSTQLTVLIGGNNPTDFSIRADACTGRALTSGQSCPMQIAFVRLEEGAATAVLEVSDQFGGIGSMTLAGSGAGYPVFVATPSSLSFGSVGTGATSASQSVSITNTGSAAAGPVATQLDDCSYYYYYCTPALDFAMTSDGCLGVQLLPGASCTIAVAFTPRYRGSAIRQLTVSGGGAFTSIALWGEGAGLSLTPESISFPATRRGTTSEARHVVVLNGSSVATGVLATVIQPSGFGIVSDACAGISLAPGASCTISVRFAPSNTGDHQGVLTISGDPGGSVSSYLLGQAIP